MIDSMMNNDCGPLCIVVVGMIAVCCLGGGGGGGGIAYTPWQVAQVGQVTGHPSYDMKTCMICNKSNP